MKKLGRKSELEAYLNSLASEYRTALSAAPSLLTEVSEAWFSGLDITVSKVAKGEVFVPVVGGFSAGKSTALNALLGRKILPEAMTAETAIPAELRYSEDEYITALNVDGNWSRHNIEALSGLTLKAASYQVVRVYLNSPVLQEIEPFILVDMPGFDSGLDQHNNAILRYLNSGALYLFLVNAKDGTINRQDCRRLEEIVELGRELRVFLSRSDLMAPNDLAATQELVSDQTSMLLGLDSVQCIDHENVTALLNSLSSAEPDRLFDGLYLNELQNLYFDANANLNTAINALSKSSSESLERLEAAQRSFDKIITEKERSLSAANNSAAMQKAELIVKRVENKLHASVDELVSHYSAGEAAIGRVVADLVRSVVTVETQKQVSTLSSDLVNRFSDAIEINLKDALEGKVNWVDNLASILEARTMDALAGLGDGQTIMKQDNTDSVVGVLGVLASRIVIYIPNPVFKVALAILPGIIGNLFDGFRDQRQKDQARDAITSQMIPQIISQIQPQISESLTQVQAEMIRAVAERFEQNILAEQKILEQVSKVSKSEREELEKSIVTLKQARSNISNLTESIVSK